MTLPGRPDGVFDYGNGIYAVDSVYDRRLQTAIHLLVEGGRAAVIDTGTAHAVPHVLTALQGMGISPEAVDYVILTHVHLDHAGGAGQLMARFPNARLTVHPRGARHMIDPSRLMAATVASVMALASGSFAASASLNQRSNCAKGSASASASASPARMYSCRRSAMFMCGRFYNDA